MNGDDPAHAQFYAQSLWRVLELVCPRNAIHYIVVQGVRRDDTLHNPQLMGSVEDGETSTAWWRLVAAKS